jgi:uncharacterized protein (TIGR03437 family)
MVGVNPTGLVPNTYTGSIQLTSTDGSTQLTIPVTLRVSNVALLNLPTSLSFTVQTGAQNGQTGQSQLVSVTSTGEAVSYLVAASVSSPPGSNWLAVGAPNGPASSTVASSFVVAVNPSGLPAGVYQGSLLVHANNGTPDTTIPVSLTVTAGNLVVSPSTLNFSQAAGASPPASQSITVNSSGSPISFSAGTTVANSIGNWLIVTPTTGTTPATLIVTVNSTNFPPGNYTGTVTITAAGSTPQTITVNLAVSQAQTLVVAPASLTFSSPAGSQAPASQTVSVTAPGGASIPFTAASITQGGSWLSVNPASGTAGISATSLTVTVNPLGLNPGTYTGQISITGQGVANGSQIVNVTYLITGVPAPAVAKIQNAASAVISPVAPGEIVSIFGSNLGPVQPVTTGVSAAGFFPTTLSGTQVLFDNIPAAMWYTSSAQINAVVPYEISGRASTVMQVVYNSNASAAVNLQVAPTAPGIFFSSGGQAAVENADGSINNPSNPAHRGTSIVIYATGEGATNPPGVTGLVIPPVVSALKHPVAPVSVTIGGQPAIVQYAGSAPGFVSGAFQVNVVVPDSAPSGTAVPVVLTVGNASSQGPATIAIQ